MTGSQNLLLILCWRERTTRWVVFAVYSYIPFKWLICSYRDTLIYERVFCRVSTDGAVKSKSSVWPPQDSASVWDCVALQLDKKFRPGSAPCPAFMSIDAPRLSKPTKPSMARHSPHSNPHRSCCRSSCIRKVNEKGFNLLSPC